MARKSAALLKSAPVKLTKIDAAFIKTMGKFVPYEAAKEQWSRVLDAAQNEAEAEGRLDALYRQVEREGGHSSCKSWAAFQEALRASHRAGARTLASIDAYLYAVKHADDKIHVDEAEIRAVIIDSLSDKLGDLQFSVNSGLLGGKLAQAIRKNVSEESAGDPPYCSDCE